MKGYKALWDSLSKSDKDIIKSIPNFDPDIFKECTGIKVDIWIERRYNNDER